MTNQREGSTHLHGTTASYLHGSSQWEDASVTDSDQANITPAMAPGYANAAASSRFDNEATASHLRVWANPLHPAGAAEKQKGPEEEESMPVGPASPTPIPINVPKDSCSLDPACWGKIDDSVRATMRPGLCQNKEADMNVSEQQYKLQKRHFSNLPMTSLCQKNGFYILLLKALYFVLLADSLGTESTNSHTWCLSLMMSVTDNPLHGYPWSRKWVWSLLKSAYWQIR